MAPVAAPLSRAMLAPMLFDDMHAELLEVQSELDALTPNRARPSDSSLRRYAILLAREELLLLELRRLRRPGLALSG